MLFNDSNLENSFNHDGFVLLDEFFSSDDIARLRIVLESFEKHTEAYLKGTSGTINDIEKGMYYTRHFQDLALEESIRSELSVACNQALKKFLSVEYKNIAALGMFKPPGSPESVLDMHVHHCNMALGSPLPGLSMFVPLDDIDDALGPLALIKGSQELWKDDLSYSLTYIKETYPRLYPLMQSYLTEVCPAAGQAILFNQFTIHKGLANTHKTAGRLAITAEFIPEDLDAVLFLPKFDEQGGVVSLHGRRVKKLPLEFSRRHRWVPEHLGEEVQTIDPYRARTISEKEFKRCCRP
jgi:hypothetical protein